MVQKPSILLKGLNVTQAASLCWLIGSLAATGATEEKLNQRYAVHPGGKLLVEVDFGSIDVTTNATSEVVIDVWRKVTRKKKADEEAFLRDNPVSFSQDGSAVTVRSHHDAKPGWSWFGTGRNQNEAKYQISVPAQFNAELRTGGGGIAVMDLTGEVKSRTGGGGLTLGRLHGATDAETGGGGIRATDCAGNARLSTGGGGIEVGGGSGSLSAKTGGGNISVRKFNGPGEIKSGGGGLTIENVSGKIDGSTGGGSISLVLPSELAEEVRVSTGGGGISITAPGTIAFTLDARTSGGRVSSEVPVSVVGKLEHGHLEGPVNGGGKSVVLRTSGGNIELKKL
jgi:hypothetical protein